MMIPFRLTLLIVFLTLGRIAVSQQQEISLTLGFGGVDYDAQENFIIIAPFSGINLYEVMAFNFGYHYAFGERKLFRLNTGLQYHVKSLKNFREQNNLHQCYVPVGINMDIGKKLHLVYGIGIQTKFLIHGLKTSNTEENAIQLGWYFNLGAGYKIGEKLRVVMTYQMNSDITPVYSKEFHSPGGATYELSFKEFEGVIQIGCFYRLN